MREKEEKKMAKKLIFVWVCLAIIACSSISIYAVTKLDSNHSNIEFSSYKIADEAAENVRTVLRAKVAEAKNKAKEEAAEEERIVKYITSSNPSVNKEEAKVMAKSFKEAAAEYDVDVYYLVAIAKGESTFYTDVTSSAGCRGLMQTSDLLAKEYGYEVADAYNAEDAIEIGTRYFKECLETFHGDYDLALSGYNHGCGAVKAGNFTYGYANKIANAKAEIGTLD